MINRMLDSRGLLSFTLVICLAGAVVAGYQLVQPTPRMRSYCALMPDSIGLYKDSAVTIMGIPQGKVTDITVEGGSARVEFEIPASRKLPPDGGATTLSDTLVADRRLALIGAEPTGAGRDPAHCITKTVTPKSMSQTFTAIADLADQLNNANSTDHPHLTVGGLAALDNATAGTGEQINTIIRHLGSVLNSPDAAIGHIGALLDALSGLAHSASNGWADIKSTLTRFAETLRTAKDTVMAPIITIFEKLRDVLPPLNDLTIMFGGPLLRRLDAVPNLPQLMTAGLSSLREAIDMMPTIADAFATAVDPATKRVSLTYAPPRVAIPEPQLPQLCSAINLITPGQCTDTTNGLVNISLTRWVLESAGAR
ncbi:MlaD family protein [Nocardia sp. NBC_01499]|uniref:MlaD family protein n=1 Tax=Nocardia sp. NBC_01499 TaxID=2903597 RepID=UPI00386E9128